MKIVISTWGDTTATLGPQDEKAVRAVLEGDDPAAELAYYLDHLTSDVPLHTDVIIEDDDGTVLFDGEL